MKRLFITLFIVAVFMFVVSASADTLTLPAKLEVIGEEAFYGDMHLDGVVLGEKVREIGARAFANSSIQSITLPASLETIADDALPAPGMLTVTAPQGSWAYDWAVNHGYIEDNWISSPLEDFVINNGVVTEYVGPGGDVVIPSKDKDRNPIIAIGDSAFHNCENVTSVTIPNSVTSIGESAFESCSNLTSVTIPNSVTSIGECAFDSCSCLTSVTIPNSVTIIGNLAFSGCSSLTSVTIPNSVTDIGEYAFEMCHSLTSVTIGSSVKSIGERAFGGCSNLLSIDVKSGNDHFSSLNGVLFNKEQTKIITCPGGKQGEYVIPNGVTSIGGVAFEGCNGLTSVTIPNSVTDIEGWAFCDCSSLTSVTIGNSVSIIMECTFRDCSSLTSVTIPNSVTDIRDWAFLDCSSLTSVTIPASVTSIGDLAFRGCDRLTTVNAETGTYAYAWAVKHGYIHLETEFEVLLMPSTGVVTEENGVRVWQHLPGTFYMDGGMAEFVVYASGDYTVEYDAGYEYVGEEEDAIELEGFIDLYAFDEDGQYYDYTHVNNGDVLSREATGLSCTIYDNRTGVVRETAIKFTCGEKTITYVFSQLPILSSRLIAPLDIAQYWESAGDSALPVYGKTDLTLEWASVPGVARYELCHLVMDADDNRWHDRYERIGSPISPTTADTFTTTIPASFWDEVGEQGEVYIVMLTYDAWGHEYKNHNFSDTQLEYCFRMIQNTDALDYDYEPVRDENTEEITGVSISGYRGAETDVVIPARVNGFSVTAIGRRAFEDNRTITSLVIPEGVTSIGIWAFDSCVNMTHVKLPSSVANIDSQAFIDCSSLAEIVIPNGVTNIDYHTFGRCNSLTNVTIPGSVIEIGESAFEECSGLTDVVICDGVQSIGVSAFKYCTSLTDIIIPPSVTNIGSGAFSLCTGLTDITIPPSVTSIGNIAFYRCTNLTIHGVPGSVAEAYANRNGIPFAAV